MADAGDWDKESEALMLGDILLSLEQAEIQARQYGHSLMREAGYLTVHSVYHLLGFDHMSEKDKKIMRKKEERVLLKLNLPR
jgi:probable rRNA maturation factor